MNDFIESDDYYGAEFVKAEDAKQYGILRKSGRYPYGSGQTGAAKLPWGSGSTQNVRNRQFLDYFDAVAAEAKKQGKPTSKAITETCKLLGISTTEYRAARSLAKSEQKQLQVKQARDLRARGWSQEKIAEKMFGSKTKESTVRSLLAPDAKDKADALENISKMLEKGVADKKYIDIGTGVEQHLGIAPDRLRVAVQRLKEKGYVVHPVQVDQLGTAPGNKTTIKVLAPPGTTYKDVNQNKGDISQLDALGQFSRDNGKSILGIAPPLSISQRRVQVKYGDEGGGLADGVIYVRPGVKDLSLGNSHYAQVRIMVGGTHFLKGMAVYKDDLPEGVDLQFNTNKQNTGNKLDAMKPLKTKKLDDGTEVIDMDNPFGAQLKYPGGQILNKNGKPTSVMNKLYEEGDWDTWSKNLSSQFLSKQSSTLASRQLDKTYEERKADLNEIMSLTNPAVRKKLLESFADGADSDAVDLKAAALPGQASHVILPIPSMKETEVYAPKFENGSKVVLVRYPHGGTFEIPELTVNNKHTGARRAFGDHPPDAIGINPKTAQQLSGADFDGDSVIVIPQKSGVTGIKTKSPLTELSGFDPQAEHPAYDGMKTIDGGIYNGKTGKVEYGPRGPQPASKQQQMGRVSNLITDMTIRGASDEKIARAVKHSMVVIDSEKHALDWRGSEEKYAIKALQKEFQPKPSGKGGGGSSTLISRAGSPEFVRARKSNFAIDPKTGKKIFSPKGEDFVDPETGKVRSPKQRSTKLAEAPDAFALTSGGSKETPGTRIEAVYAAHSNRMKDLANLARKASVEVTFEKADPKAAKVYAEQVKSLNAKLALAIRNRPYERQAQVYANQTLASKRADYPDMDKQQEKRIRFQALQQARARTGAKKQEIDITDDEWKAIQARAISPSKLVQILNNADVDRVRSLATPRVTATMRAADLSQARQLWKTGKVTQFELAQRFGVSLTTLKNSLKEEG